MKLLFAVKTTDSHGGGAERVLMLVTAGLVARGHDVTLLSFDHPDSAEFYAFDPAIRRVWLGSANCQRPSSVPDTIERVRSLRAAVRRIAPDVAIGFMHSAYLPLALALTGLDIPVIASEHAPLDHFALRPIDRYVLLATAPLLKRITVVSEQVKAGFPKRLAKRMTVIPNPVAPPGGKTPRALLDRSKRILNVGRLVEQKSQDLLIAAFARIASRFPEWQLRIVGEGILRGDLHALAIELGIDRQVELPGSTQDIDAEYADSQIFAIPSSYESLGLVTAEALAAGVPAVGFADCPGTNILIKDGVNGILIDHPDRAEGLAGVLARLIVAPELRVQLGAAGPSSIDYLSTDIVIDQWEQLITGIRARQPNPRSAAGNLSIADGAAIRRRSPPAKR